MASRWKKTRKTRKTSSSLGPNGCLFTFHLLSDWTDGKLEKKQRRSGIGRKARSQWCRPAHYSSGRACGPSDVVRRFSLDSTWLDSTRYLLLDADKGRTRAISFSSIVKVLVKHGDGCRPARLARRQISEFCIEGWEIVGVNSNRLLVSNFHQDSSKFTCFHQWFFFL